MSNGCHIVTVFRALSLMAALAVPGPGINLYAQALTAQISGSVQDPTGKVVPSARVELVNTETAQSREASTDAAGSFVFTQLLPGTYRITVSAPGFKTYHQDRIALAAAERLVLRDIMLQLGEVTESVTVTADVARLQTQSAERAGTIDRAQIQILPAKGRDIMDFVRLLPGVVDVGAHDAPGFNSIAGMNINGARRRTINVTFDGVSAVDVGSQIGPLSTPNMDAIAEVRVLLTNYQAEYGRSSGATINLVTRNGTKEFHGGAVYFKRNEFFNANEYFNNQFGLPKPRYRYDYPSYNIGGPVLIPGTNFNRNRDKLFFFWSQDFLPRKFPTPQVRRTFPTTLERRGDFTRTFDTNGSLIPILDPLDNRRPFPGNIVPTSRIDHSGQGLLNLFPLPDVFDPSYTYNSVFQSTRTQNRNEQMLRADWNISPTTTFFARGTDGAETFKGDFMSLLASSSWPQMGIRFYLPTQFLSTSLIHTFNPTLVNELTFGISRAHSQVSATDPQTLDANNRVKLGLNIPQFNPESNPYNVVPNAIFGGIPNAPQLFIEQRFPYFGTFNTYILSNNVSKIYSRHNLKFGIYMEKVSNNKQLASAFNGTFDFSRNVNNPFDANHAFANALLGSVNSYSESNRHPVGHGRNMNIEWFAQDNWRVTSKLSLDIGLRFYKIIPVSSEGDELAYFDFASYDPGSAPRLIEPYRASATSPRLGRNPNTGEIVPEVKIGSFAPGAGRYFEGMRVVRDKVMQSPSVQVAPRFGFAYDLFGDGRTALRGGFGAFPDLFYVDLILGLITQPPVTTTSIAYYTTIRDLLSTPLSLSPSSVMGIQTKYNPPTMYNWSFGVQRDIGLGTILDVAYVGSVGRHLAQWRSLNALPYGTNFLPTSIDPTLSGNRPLPANFLRPIRGFADITYFEFSSTSNYNSLQTQVIRRFGRDFIFAASWTWSKALGLADLEEVLNPFLNPRMRHYGKLGFDRTHNFVLNYRYRAPKLSVHWNNAFSRAIFDNWEIAGITSFISGAPSGISYSLVQAIDITGAAGAGVDSRVNLMGNPNLPKKERTISRHFRTEVVRPPDPSNFGIGNAPKDPIRGPGINNWDISVIKNFPWGAGDRRAFQFRFEMYNAFNHTQFSGVDVNARFDALGNQVNPRFGEYNAARDARRIQLGLKFFF